jgi:hypothetical protein
METRFSTEVSITEILSGALENCGKRHVRKSICPLNVKGKPELLVTAAPQG